MTELKIHIPGSKWRPSKKTLFIILKCLEKNLEKLGENQGISSGRKSRNHEDDPVSETVNTTKATANDLKVSNIHPCKDVTFDANKRVEKKPDADSEFFRGNYQSPRNGTPVYHIQIIKYLGQRKGSDPPKSAKVAVYCVCKISK